jgi:hypothetical protein
VLKVLPQEAQLYRRQVELGLNGDERKNPRAFSISRRGGLRNASAFCDLFHACTPKRWHFQRVLIRLRTTVVHVFVASHVLLSAI